MNRISSIVIAITLITLISCSSDKAKKSIESAPALTGVIKIDGSSTVYPITEAIAEEFRNLAPKVKVTIGISGTGGGFKKFGRGETDISDASRPIKDKEALDCKENGIEYLELPVAYDGIAVVVNPENDWVSSLTIEELKKVWEPDAQNSIMNWSQIRAGFPNQNLVLMGPGSASGTFDYFTKAIVGTSGSSRGDYMPSEDDHVLVQGVAGDKGALGFFGLAYYLENRDKLKLVAVETAEGKVLPTMETIKNGSYRPLSRPIFIYVSNTAAAKKEVVEFVKFYLNEADELVPDVGYIPLSEEMYKESLMDFDSFLNK